MMFWNLRFPLPTDRRDIVGNVSVERSLVRSSFDPRPSCSSQWCRCRNRQGKHRSGSIHHLKPFTTRVNTCLSLEYFRIISCVAAGKENITCIEYLHFNITRACGNTTGNEKYTNLHWSVYLFWEKGNIFRISVVETLAKVWENSKRPWKYSVDCSQRISRALHPPPPPLLFSNN